MERKIRLWEPCDNRKTLRLSEISSLSGCSRAKKQKGLTVKQKGQGHHVKDYFPHVHMLPVWVNLIERFSDLMQFRFEYNGHTKK